MPPGGLRQVQLYNKLDVTNDEVGTGASAGQTGGLSAYRGISAASNNAAVIKASAGRVYVVHAISGAAVNSFLKLYDKATAPAPADDAALLRGTFPVISTGGKVELDLSPGVAFANGIGIAIVRNASDTDNTAVAANDVIFNIYYK